MSDTAAWEDAELNTTPAEEEGQKVELTPSDIQSFVNASIYSSCLLIKAGNELVFKNSTNAVTVLANLALSASIPVEVAIGNSKGFVAVLQNCNKPELELFKDYLYVNDKALDARYRYVYAEKAAIEPWIPKVSRFNTKSAPVATFDITKEDLNNVSKGAKILVHDWLYFEGKNGKIRIITRKEKIINETTRAKVMNGNQFELGISGSVQSDFSAAVKLECIHFIPGDYSVSVHPDDSKVVFTNKAGGMTYWVAIQ